MSKLTKAELEYVQSQGIARLGTVNRRGEPQVKAVGFQYNAELDTIDIRGMGMATSQKFRNIASNSKVSFLVDDVTPNGEPGFIEIRGDAQALVEGGQGPHPTVPGLTLPPAMIRIFPTRIVAWDSSGRFPSSSRTVDHDASPE
ncbi:MAG: PPOX class F420-dependent oxidoreductase [Thermomicrobiales bacterium]